MRQGCKLTIVHVGLAFKVGSKGEGYCTMIFGLVRGCDWNVGAFDIQLSVVWRYMVGKFASRVSRMVKDDAGLQ